MQLTADKLLYSCDIALASQETENDLKFLALGQFRLGPLSSKINIQSEFLKLGSDIVFKRYRVEAERIGFYENYEFLDGVIQYSNSKGQEIRIDLNNQAFQDPLSFLFQLVSEGKTAVDKKEIPLLIGKKIEKISSEKVDGLLQFIKKSKIMAFIKTEIDKWVIEIPKLKIKLKLFFS